MSRSHEKEKMSPEEIARLDAEAYDEPERDLQATRPVHAKGAGAVGDEDNPRSEDVARGADSARGVERGATPNANPGKLAETTDT